MRYLINVVGIDPETLFLGDRRRLGHCAGPSRLDCEAALGPILHAALAEVFELVQMGEDSDDEPGLSLDFGSTLWTGIVRNEAAESAYMLHFWRKGVR